ncbi:MAG: hypothetical protein WCB31_08300 [Nitrososphaeraceae archaeon]|jgi:hypothetical protein|nr:hypothetical protein [Nitrososphaeraceae archaeon]
MRHTLIILLLAATGLYFILPVASAQFTADIMITDMRTTHTVLEKNVDEVITLLKNNNTVEALNLLDGVKMKVHHMNSMFDDLVWELSNRGH